jgi:hypothetical protein
MNDAIRVCGECHDLLREMRISEVYTHIDMHFRSGRRMPGLDSVPDAADRLSLDV